MPLVRPNAKGFLHLFTVLVPANNTFHSVGGIAADRTESIALQLVCLELFFVQERDRHDSKNYERASYMFV